MKKILVFLPVFIIFVGAGCRTEPVVKEPAQESKVVCSEFTVEACPDNCVVCPPCDYCSSISCQTEEFCANMGFDKDWYDENVFKPGDGDDEPVASDDCGIENCHGMDIVCGPNPAEVCTEIYMLGDKCRQFASCGMVQGECELILSDEFVACKACVENCASEYGDAIEMFNCESNC